MASSLARGVPESIGWEKGLLVHKGHREKRKARWPQGTLENRELWKTTDGKEKLKSCGQPQRWCDWRLGKRFIGS